LKEKSLIKLIFCAKFSVLRRFLDFPATKAGSLLLRQFPLQEVGRMQTREAIISFSQSEKVKTGLIWCNQCLQVALNLPPDSQPGAMQMVRNLVSMIASESQLARQVSKDDIWMEVDKSLNTARVMLDSKVEEEATYHLTQALSQVNRIGQQAMTELLNQGLLT
jgi:hypothetical protein